MQRRGFPRAQGPWRGRFRRSRLGRWTQFDVIDLSTGGAALLAERDVPQGRRIEMELWLVGDPRSRVVRATAVVQNRTLLGRQLTRLGVRFLAGGGVGLRAMLEDGAEL